MPSTEGTDRPPFDKENTGLLYGALTGHLLRAATSLQQRTYTKRQFGKFKTPSIDKKNNNYYKHTKDKKGQEKAP